MSLYLSASGAPEPSQSSLDGHKKCWTADYTSNPNRLPPLALASSGKPRPKTWTYANAECECAGITGCPTSSCRNLFPPQANGTEELSNLPDYTYYWYTDRFSMYNAYSLEPGPFRELLAIHTPLGFLELTRMVFGEMNAGTVACAATPAIIRTLPDNAHLRTASYVEDHAQGSHTFADLLK
jgi:hypothetical protein